MSTTPTPVERADGNHAMSGERNDEADRIDAACAWSDYRKEYGVSADVNTLRREHKAFLAGWQAARGTLDVGGVQR